MSLHSTLSVGPAQDLVDCFLNDRRALTWLYCHAYLVDDFVILWHVPTFVS